MNEPIWLRVWGEFTELVGLLGDALVDLGAAMQKWSRRRRIAQNGR